MIIGIDEVGYGPLAGPVVVAAVAGVEHLPQHVKSQLDDSKNITAAKRETLYDAMTANQHIVWAPAVATVQDIETHNILRASHLAMMAAARVVLKKITDDRNLLLIDGNKLPQEWRDNDETQPTMRTVVKGDGFYASIAAASIMAKVYRDRLMDDYHQQYPDYNFTKHKGYGTAQHVAVIKKIGPCPIHRSLFLRKILAS
ncbi:MAG: ribonuclease HII [Hydrotalea sp.]|nr:ribonuclease HII [Hydrotalea sp.]